MHAGKLGQVTNFRPTTVGGTALTSTWFCFTTVRSGATAMPGGVHARLCHAFLVVSYHGIKC